MSTGEYDLKIFAGDDFALELTFHDGLGAPVDLSGSTFAATVRSSEWAEVPAASFTVDETSKATGVLVLHLDHATTVALPRAGVWSLQRTVTTGGLVQTVLGGKVRMTRDAPVTTSMMVTVDLEPDQVTVVSTTALGPAGPAGTPGSVSGVGAGLSLSGGVVAQGGATVPNQVLKEWTSAGSYEATAITYDATHTSTVSTATVKWPDGSAGVFTTDTIDATWETVDAFHITHVASGKTVTQTAVTRDATTGVVTAKPALTVA